jgi:hypothetical protein
MPSALTHLTARCSRDKLGLTKRLDKGRALKKYARRTALLTIGIAAFATPGPAGAAVTIGSNLESAPTLPGLFCQNTPCTASHIALPASSTAPGGLVAPIDGVVVRWRIKVENDVIPVALRITRPGIGAARTGAGTGPSVTPAPGAISTFEIRLPIHEGDALGIDCCQEANLDAFGDTAGAHFSVWNPRLEDGAPLRVVSPMLSQELLVNADIEPDCDSDGRGDETQDTNISACHPRTLTLDANDAKVREGQKVLFSGQLVSVRQDAAGCAADQTVELQRKKRKASFTTFEQLQTDAAGSFFTKEKVKKTFKYRALVPETATCAGGISDTEKVKVKKR